MARLTIKAVENIRPTKARREIPDFFLPGLYLIVQPSGVKSWAVRYRNSDDRPRKHTLGPYPALDLKAARELGAKALRAAAEGRDPAQEKKKEQAATVQEVVAAFIERHCKRNNRPRTLKESERLLRLYVVSRWGRRQISSITRVDIRDMLERLVTDTPIQANRVHGITRKLFNWCAEQEIITASPMAGMKPPAAKSSRDRVLNNSELRLIWQAADKMGPPYGPLVQLLMLTGQRLSEVANMEWQELDIENQLWTLPRERVKNNRRHEIPLSAQAVAVIDQIPRISDRFVFTTNGVVAASNFGKNKRKLDALLPDMPDWTIHDIRRSVASGMAGLGISLPVIEKVLNHISGSFSGIVAVYQHHDFAKEKRNALQAWGNHIAGLEDTKVITLRR